MKVVASSRGGNDGENSIPARSKEEEREGERSDSVKFEYTWNFGGKKKKSGEREDIRDRTGEMDRMKLNSKIRIKFRKEKRGKTGINEIKYTEEERGRKWRKILFQSKEPEVLDKITGVTRSPSGK